jgi:hypothetical protein
VWGDASELCTHRIALDVHGGLVLVRGPSDDDVLELQRTAGQEELGLGNVDDRRRAAGGSLWFVWLAVSSRSTQGTEFKACV